MAYTSDVYRMQRIDIQYKEAMRKADRLEELANKLSRRAADEIRNLSDDISRQWEGEEAEAFLKKTSIIESDISKIVKNIRSCAATIRKIAKQTMQTEMQAAQIASERTS